MNPSNVLDIARQALETLLVVSAPILGVALAVGLLVSVLQAITQINEATLSFLPKLIAVAVTIGLAGPWVLAMLTDYIRRTLMSIPTLVSG
ncbi:MAG: flagellar biosynthesis protein FliQ [Burkholderiaceae bacterium]